MGRICISAKWRENDKNRSRKVQKIFSWWVSGHLWLKDMLGEMRQKRKQMPYHSVLSLFEQLCFYSES